MAAHDLETEVTERDGRAFVRVDGEVDLGTTPTFAAAIQAGVALGLPELVIDARGVTFLSSAGMSALLGESARFTSEGGKVVIRPSPVVARWLNVTGLITQFETDWGQDSP